MSKLRWDRQGLQTKQWKIARQTINAIETSQFIWKINAWDVININVIQSWIEDCRAA